MRGKKFKVSAELEDPAPPHLSGVGKIKGRKSSVLPTELLGHMLKNAPNLKIDQYSIIIYYIKALKSIFDTFAPTCSNLDLCQVDSFEKTQLFI